LTSKIPWCENTYKPPQSDIFKRADEVRDNSEALLADGILPGENTDSVALAVQVQYES
jgi:hypothetical protein